MRMKKLPTRSTLRVGLGPSYIECRVCVEPIVECCAPSCRFRLGGAATLVERVDRRARTLERGNRLIRGAVRCVGRDQCPLRLQDLFLQRLGKDQHRLRANVEGRALNRLGAERHFKTLTSAIPSGARTTRMRLPRGP